MVLEYKNLHNWAIKKWGKYIFQHHGELLSGFDNLIGLIVQLGQLRYIMDPRIIIPIVIIITIVICK